ncbi:MAG: TatD family hydrolase [Conexivisphaerales archaeon]
MHIISNMQELSEMQRNYNIYVIMNTTSLEDFDDVMRYSMQNSSMVSAFAGLHPNSDQDELEAFTEKMRKNANSIDGIGEIGLDSRTYSNKQLKVFKAQLEIAEKLEKPVSIHSRGKVQEILDILPSFRLRKVLMHWPDCTPSELSRIVQRGYFVSFGPATVYSKRLSSLAMQASMESILVESDSPVKYGACFLARESNPSYIVSVIFHIAMIKKVETEFFEDITRKNSIAFLDKSIDM